MGLVGSVALAGDSSKNTPAGDYTIVFDREVSPDDIVVMLEPALEIKITLFLDGNEVTDPDSIPANADGLSAKASVYEAGTDNLVADSLLPSGVQYSMEHSENGSVIESVEAFELNDIKVTGGPNEISATMTLPGYFTVKSKISFEVSTLNITKITAEIAPDGSDKRTNKDGTPDADNVVYYETIKDNKTGVKFTVYNDGVPIDASTAQSITDEFKASLSSDYTLSSMEIDICT